MAQPTTGTVDPLKSTITPSKPTSPSSIPSTPSSPRSLSKSTAETPTRRNLSSFAPWDRDQFVGRLASFKHVFWSQLPDELCELEWARRGWVERRDGKKGVECGLCHGNVEVIWDWNQLRESVLKQRQLQEESAVNNATENATDTETEKPETQDSDITPKEPASTINSKGLKENTDGSGTNGDITKEGDRKEEDIYSTPPVDDAQSTNFLLKHYTPLLSSGHTTKCPWRSRITDITVLRLPPQLLSLPSLQTRLTTLTPILPFLPSTERIVTPKPLPSNLPKSLQDYDLRLVDIGITGWSGSLLGHKGILTCATCHRRVGLWLFVEETRMEELDLVAEHKRYCPWINKDVQTGMAGWEYVFSLVEPRGSSKRDWEGDGNGDAKESRFKRLREMLKGVKK